MRAQTATMLAVHHFRRRSNASEQGMRLNQDFEGHLLDGGLMTRTSGLQVALTQAQVAGGHLLRHLLCESQPEGSDLEREIGCQQTRPQTRAQEYSETVCVGHGAPLAVDAEPRQPAEDPAAKRSVCQRERT